MNIKLENKILISGVIVGMALAFIGTVTLWNSSNEAFGANRADLTSCVASSTYFHLAENTTTRILATSTSRMHVKVEATSTPGASMFALGLYTNTGVPTGLDLEGPMLMSASSSLVLVSEENRDIGPIYARSRESVAGIMVTECNYQ